jgi:plasmid replication initiation protein
MESNSENISKDREHLINFFSKNKNEKELSDIRKLISLYYAKLATLEADKVWDEKGWTNETMEEFLKTHMRTPYNNENRNVDLNSIVADVTGKYNSSK